MVNESAGANLRGTKMLIDMMKDIEQFASQPPQLRLNPVLVKRMYVTASPPNVVHQYVVLV